MLSHAKTTLPASPSKSRPASLLGPLCRSMGSRCMRWRPPRSPFSSVPTTPNVPTPFSMLATAIFVFVMDRRRLCRKTFCRFPGLVSILLSTVCRSLVRHRLREIGRQPLVHLRRHLKCPETNKDLTQAAKRVGRNPVLHRWPATSAFAAPPLVRDQQRPHPGGQARRKEPGRG